MHWTKNIDKLLNRLHDHVCHMSYLTVGHGPDRSPEQQFYALNKLEQDQISLCSRMLCAQLGNDLVFVNCQKYFM